MRAAYRALCEYGYADLTIQRIGEQSKKSTSLIYYHYDDKDELLLDFLDFMLERYEDRIQDLGTRQAPKHLEDILNQVFELFESEKVGNFSRAMVELRAQAAHDPEFRKHFTQSDQFFQDQIVDVVRMGIEDGDFQDIDPQQTASMIHSIIVGTMTGHVTTNNEVATQIRDEVDRYLKRCVLVDEE